MGGSYAQLLRTACDNCEVCNDSVLNEVTLPLHIGVIGLLPRPPEERFDLAFLHAAYQPLSRKLSTNFSEIFDETYRDYCDNRRVYVQNTYRQFMRERTNPKVWLQLADEAAYMLGLRDLFSDQAYREKMIQEYLRLLSTDTLDKIVINRYT